MRPRAPISLGSIERMATMPDKQVALGWNPVRVAQATAALLPIAIAIGGADIRVVVPVGVVCALGVVRRGQPPPPPPPTPRPSLPRAGRGPQAPPPKLPAYTPLRLPPTYHLFSPP